MLHKVVCWGYLGQWVTVGALASDTPISDPSPVDISWMLFLQVPLKTQLSIVKCGVCVCVCVCVCVFVHMCVYSINMGDCFMVGFSCGSAVKESACNIGDLGSIPGLGRSSGEGKGYPLQYSVLENSVQNTVHGFAKSQTRLSDFHFRFHSTYKLNKQGDNIQPYHTPLPILSQLFHLFLTVASWPAHRLFRRQVR